MASWKMRTLLGLAAVGGSGVVASTCPAGAPWSAIDGAVCPDFMKCCDQVPADMRPKMDDFKMRTGNLESLISALYKGLPHSLEFGTGESMASAPYSVEFMTGLPTEVSVGVTLRSVTGVNQKAQTIKLQYQLMYTWRDCRLIHNCADILNFNSNHPNFAKFWRPPYGIKQRVGTAGEVASQLWVEGSGRVYMSEDRESEFKCKFDFADMPFDKQTCALDFYFPGQNISKLKLRWHEALTEELSNSEWDFATDLVLSEPNNENVLFGQTESALQLGLVMSRRPGFQIQVYLFPAILFYVISWVMLFVDINAVPGRVAGAIIPVLTMSGLLNNFSASLPPISYETRIKSVMLGTLVFIIFHMVEFGIVHTSTRIKKAMPAKKVDAENAGDEGAAEAAPSAAQQIKTKLVIIGADYLEIGMRWLSPLFYILMVVLVLAV